ncbi:hypothetical protein HPP92_007917 [Vanilla planifolia]|uniref:Uncharacterized protein n=1 Tax=Vanilla planifolia TaxID=51239 RepID=A0A835RL43_VANPL|nr:hypothetical protein HPP92_007917 [Vanilla planifolia]
MRENRRGEQLRRELKEVRDKNRVGTVQEMWRLLRNRLTTKDFASRSEIRSAVLAGSHFYIGLLMPWEFSKMRFLLSRGMVTLLRHKVQTSHRNCTMKAPSKCDASALKNNIPRVGWARKKNDSHARL